jgi:hypothetical protein
MASILPSRFIYILAAYIIVVKENETGETIENTNDSLEAFSSIPGLDCWKEATLLLRQDAKGLLIGNLTT